RDDVGNELLRRAAEQLVGFLVAARGGHGGARRRDDLEEVAPMHSGAAGLPLSRLAHAGIRSAEGGRGPRRAGDRKTGGIETAEAEAVVNTAGSPTIDGHPLLARRSTSARVMRSRMAGGRTLRATPL